MLEGDTRSWVVREGGSTGLGFCLLACKGGVQKVSWVHSFLAKLRQKSKNKVWEWQPTPVFLILNRARRATVHGATKSQTRLSNSHTHTHTHTHTHSVGKEKEAGHSS